MILDVERLPIPFLFHCVLPIVLLIPFSTVLRKSVEQGETNGRSLLVIFARVRVVLLRMVDDQLTHRISLVTCHKVFVARMLGKESGTTF